MTKQYRTNCGAQSPTRRGKKAKKLGVSVVDEIFFSITLSYLCSSYHTQIVADDSGCTNLDSRLNTSAKINIMPSGQ